MKSQPTPPAAPDYAAANQAGVTADINALPLRNAINAATTLGTSYTDPDTGKTYDFTGLGTTAVANQQLQQQLDAAPQIDETLLKLQQQYGPQFAEAARASLQATDPTGFALRDQFGSKLLNGQGTNSELVANQKAPSYEQMSGSGPDIHALSQSDAPTLQHVDPAAQMADTGAAAAGRSSLENGIFDKLAESNSGAIDPVLQRAAEQAARARGASSGNLMGDGSALQESLAVQQAAAAQQQQRQSDALNLLQSGQTTSDTTNRNNQQNFNNAGTAAQFNNGTDQQSFQNRAAINDQQNSAANQAFQNTMAAVGQRNQALQNSFASQQAVAQQQIAARQSDTANTQSYLGLSPIVAQGSMLSGLQQGAAPTTSGTGYNAVGSAQNAGQLGSGFAGNVFGTQANIFGTQSSAATAANSMMLNAAGGLASGFVCHVARLVYGQRNPRWIVFYYWKEHAAPKWFKAAYNRFAPQIAAMIRPFPLMQSAVRRWMDSKIQLA